MANQLGRDVILHIFRYLHLYDVIALMFANVLPSFTAAGIELSLPVIADFDLQVETVYDVDGEDNDEYEHLHPVVRNVQNPGPQNLPRGNIILEPQTGKTAPIRHSYRPGQFKPAFVRLRWRTQTYDWTLKPGYSGVAGEVPLTNTYKIVANDRFKVFQYWHEEDVLRVYPIRVFYKTGDDDKILLHCVSIPLKLLSIVLEKNCNPGDWLYSTGVLSEHPGNSS